MSKSKKLLSTHKFLAMKMNSETIFSRRLAIVVNHSRTPVGASVARRTSLALGAVAAVFRTTMKTSFR